MKILEKLFPDNEPLEVKLDNAEQVFKQEKEDEIQEAREKAGKFREEIEEELQGLRAAVEKMEGFEDEKGRKAVDDISENLVEDRKELIDEINLTEDPEHNLEQLKQFLREFQSMKKKEAAVLEITAAHKDIAGKLKELEEDADKIQEFIEDQYQIVDNFNQVKNSFQAKREQEMEIEGLRKEINSKNTDEIEEKIKEKKEEIKEYRDGEEMSEYRDLEDKIDEKKSDRSSEFEKLENACRKMHRGLKKLIYSAEKEGLNLEKVEVLRDIRDQKVDALRNRDPDKVRESVKQLESLDDEISDTQMEKLLDGAEVIEQLNKINSEIISLEEEIEGLESELEDYEAISVLEEKEKELKALEEKLDERKEELNSLEEELENQKANRDGIVSEIKQAFRSSFDREVEFV